MRNALTLLVSAIMIGCCCGFVESSRIIKINNDGSGEILVRVLYNPKQMEETDKAHDAEALKKIVYGKGVEYVISTEIKGKNDWIGYLAKYTFKDISELRIFPASSPGANTANIDDALYKSGWKFEIKGGGGDEFDVDEEVIDQEAKEDDAPALKEPEAPAPNGEGEKDGKAEEGEGGAAPADAFSIMIIPLFLEFPEEDEGDDFGGEEGEEEGGEEDAIEDLDRKILQKGRRYVTYLKFESDVDRANSVLPKYHFSELEKNVIVLNDEQFMVMWSSSAARARIVDAPGEHDFAAYVDDPAKVKGYRAITSEATIIFK